MGGRTAARTSVFATEHRPVARSRAETVLSSASDGRRSPYRWLAVSVLISGGDPGARGRASRVDAGEVTDGKRGEPRARMSAEGVKLSVRDRAVGWRIVIRWGAVVRPGRFVDGCCSLWRGWGACLRRGRQSVVRWSPGAVRFLLVVKLRVSVRAWIKKLPSVNE